jgi:serine phosphatase RsbU (regulator of sigma subunit)
MLGISFLNEIITKNNTDSPAKILEKLRKRVKKALNQTGKTFEQKDGMDITLLFINFETLKLEFAAANNSATLVRHNQIIDLPADKMPIGVHHKEYPFTNNIIDLQKGDIIYTYSDGYQDQFGGQHGRKLLIKNFKQIMLEIHKKPLSEQNQFLSDYLDNWMLHKDYSGNTYLQVDDILVMGIKI